MSEQNYAKRLYQLAISAPEVDIFNDEEREMYIRQKAVELQLDPDEMVEQCQQYEFTTNDLKVEQ